MRARRWWVNEPGASFLLLILILIMLFPARRRRSQDQEHDHDHEQERNKIALHSEVHWGQNADMAKLIVRSETGESVTAEQSARPAGFANASPFPGRKTKKDPARTAVFAAAAVAFAAFLASMIAIALMKPPTF